MYAHAETNASPAALQPTLCVLCRACVVISIDPSTARDLDDALHVQVGGVSSIEKEYRIPVQYQHARCF